MTARGRQAHETARITADRAGAPAASRHRGMVDLGIRDAPPLHLLPDSLPVEHRVRRDRGKHQRAQRIERDPDLNVDHVGQLDVSDEHAEQIDLDQRPRFQVLDPAIDLAEMTWRTLHPEPGQHVYHAGEPEKRRGDGREQHDRGQFPHPVLLQSFRTREKIGAELHSGGADRHQRHEAGDPEQEQARNVQRQRAAERITPRPAQHRIAAQAARDRVRPERGDHLQQPAIRALPQPRLRHVSLGARGDTQQAGEGNRGGHSTHSAISC